MGRLGWYAGVSTALAAGVVASAFNQRANFYSACVYLQQSNLCLMVLINLTLLIYSSVMYGLQRLCYGPLRPIEIEQLYEKGWFAVTETCLAMTIFREEVGPWFLVMFVALITGKAWGWIGDGRVEILEQQPPANPRLFHIRLSVSLAISVIYDIWMMSYAINTVIQQARPNMMVMFLFEFTILTTSSLSTGVRYLISLHEARVVKTQTRERLAERRRELREERAEMIRQREEVAAAAAAGGEVADATPSTEPLPSEDDVEELDIEVPGWETKGQWILTLDLVTDFAKLSIYVTFFFILLLFYGIPIHIMRDLFMTTRSFLRRLSAFLRYRRATHDMNKRYGDATVEDIEREDTCIICREQMRPWSVINPQAVPAAPGAAPAARPTTTLNERSRPKKLPCGHILHLGCLKSWLERQQVCPTCRRPVVNNSQAVPNAANNANQAAQPPGEDQPDGAGAGPRAARRPNMRVLNLGPFRVGFGQANLQDLAAVGGQAAEDNAARVYGLELGLGRRPPPQPQQPQRQPQAQVEAQYPLQVQRGIGLANDGTVHERLQQIEQHIITEIRGLQLMEQELQLVRHLQNELARLRHLQGDLQITNMEAQARELGTSHTTLPRLHRHGARGDTVPIPSNSAGLPPGVEIPDGWSLLPLQRVDGATRVVGRPVSNSRPVSTTAGTQHSNIVMPNMSNIPRGPIPRPNPEQTPRESSSDSSDANAIHTPTSTSGEQSSSSVSPASGNTHSSNAPVARTSAVPSSLNEAAQASLRAQFFGNPGSSNVTAPSNLRTELFADPGSSNVTAPSNLGTELFADPSPSNEEAQPSFGTQVFSNPSQTTTTVNGHENPTPGPITSRSSAPVDAGQSSSMSRPVPEGGSEISRRETGNARAATVEDTTDDGE